MESEKQEHPYITSLRHALTVIGCGAVIFIFLCSGHWINFVYNWNGSNQIASNMGAPEEYQGPAYKGRK